MSKGGRTPQYYIGIDLGTSNCALAYVDNSTSAKRSIVLPIPQAISDTLWQERHLLPSVLYRPLQTETESSKDILDRYEGWIVGTFAQQQQQFQPDRVISSSKSWFNYGAVDRMAKILPTAKRDINDVNEQAIREDEKISPVKAATILLRYLKDTWNSHSALPPFDEQKITITVPASFDAGALELTRLSSVAAEYPDDVLFIEEPQAAFYYFLEENYYYYKRTLLPKAPLTILVCDIGGGTTDFNLFKITSDGILERIAVSPHILLGGDNIDLTLMHYLEQSFSQKLSKRNQNYLLGESRKLKENILSGTSKVDSYTVTIPSESSNLFADTLSTTVKCKQIETYIMEHFFPFCSENSRVKRNLGLRDLGLPYAKDYAITHHLAEFLDGQHVDALLCTGGTLVPDVLQMHLGKIIESWQNKPLLLLPNNAMTLAVARGAARYRLALSGKSTVIKSGYPHALYLVVQDRTNDSQIVCLLPKGAMVNEIFEIKNTDFEAILGMEVLFQLVSSSAFPQDTVGTCHPLSKEFHALPPFSAQLEAALRERGSKVPITLSAKINELGALCLFCHRKDNIATTSELKINLRAPNDIIRTSSKSLEQQSPEIKIQPDRLNATFLILQKYWGKATAASKGLVPRNILKELETELKTSREQWSAIWLRSLWTHLLPGQTRRNRSLMHEEQFYIAAGYFLRPGFGVELDTMRVAELWRCYDLGLVHRKEKKVIIQWWIMWRRVSGGLNAEQQIKLYNSTKAHIWQEPEALKLVASLEYIPHEYKIELGSKLVKNIAKMADRISPRSSLEIPVPWLWALNRLIDRNPIYAGSVHLLEPTIIENWYSHLEKYALRDVALTRSLLGGLSATISKDDEVNDVVKNSFKIILQRHQLPIDYLYSPPVRTTTELSRLTGDVLPIGLKISNHVLK